MKNIKKHTFLLLSLAFLAALIYAYSNHFNNGFYFDDIHTIVNNGAIRDVSNIPEFFTNIETFGTMQNNRSYRPVITTLNAIDYWMGGELDQRYFHYSIFLSYILLGFALFFVFLKLFNKSYDSTHNKYIALFSVGFYMLHAANAETINYIIMRSDSFSTLCAVLGLASYMSKRLRKFQIHLLFLVLGIAAKESALMLVPILFLYILFFEYNVSLIDVFSFKRKRESLSAVKKILPSLVVGLVFFWFSRYYFRENVGLLEGISIDPIQYFYSQWIVIMHYIANFILPIELSADPDFELLSSFMNHRVIFSGMFLLTIFIGGIWISKYQKWRVVSFGILWFFIALAPTSSIVPFGQVSNDHRTFFPYIGLVLAMGYAIGQIVFMNLDRLGKYPFLKYSLILTMALIYCGHIYGTRQRNKVWSSPDSLWKDVTIKSPKNGRGLMNYGLTLMSKAKYNETEKYFNEALKYLPYYSYLHINIAILKNAQGKPLEAEPYFLNALTYDPTNAEAYRFYARYLLEKNRTEEAINLVNMGLKYSPNHVALLEMQSSLASLSLPFDDKLSKQLSLVKEHPTTDNYLNLSLLYYNEGMYRECIEACEIILEMDPNNISAYNNICISFTKLGNKELAIQACEMALALDPDFNLAKNNLSLAKSLKK